MASHLLSVFALGVTPLLSAALFVVSVALRFRPGIGSVTTGAKLAFADVKEADEDPLEATSLRGEATSSRVPRYSAQRTWRAPK